MTCNTKNHPAGQPGGERILPAAGAAAVAMAVFFLLYPTFVTVGPNLVPDPLDPGGGSKPAWKPTSSLAEFVPPSAAGAPLFVVRSDGKTKGSWTTTLTEWPDAVAFRISCRAACDNVTRGPHAWQFARMTSYCIDRGGRPRFDWPHIVFSLDGDRPEQAYDRQLLVPPGAKTAVVSVANAGLSGVLRVREIDIRTVIRNPANRFWIPFWALAWAGMFLWSLSRIGPFRTAWQRMVLMLALLAIGGAIVPSQWIKGVRWKSNRALEWVEARLRQPVPPPAAPAPPAPADTNRPAAAPARPARTPPAAAVSPDSTAMVEYLRLKLFHDAGHLAVYTLLGLASCLAYRRNGAGAAAVGMGRLIATLAIFALATETLQFLTTTRSPSWSNAVTNLAGLALGLILFAAIRLAARLGSRAAA